MKITGDIELKIYLPDPLVPLLLATTSTWLSIMKDTTYTNAGQQKTLIVLREFFNRSSFVR